MTASNRSTAGRRGRLGLLAAAAAGLVALAVLAVVAGTPPTSSRPQAAPTTTSSTAVGVAPHDPQVDLGHAEQVCAAFATALFTVAVGDDSPREVYQRAAAYATAELAAALLADHGRQPVQRPTPGGVEVTGYVGDHMRPDTEGVAYRAVLVTLTSRERTTGRYVVYCTLQQTAGRWLVAGYEQERSLLP